AGKHVLCQRLTRDHAERATDCCGDIIVAQGPDGGGHAGTRATLTLVPEIADFIARRAPHTLLCAAGGIADGRGLAAALMLGAEGVVVGTRFWASQEALVQPGLHAAALAAGGDDTVRQSVLDIVRGRPWPARYTGRVLNNEMVRTWMGRESELRAVRDDEAARYYQAAKAGDANVAATIVGEAVGLIDAIEPAGEILGRMAAGAEALLKRGDRLCNERDRVSLRPGQGGRV